MLVAVPFGLLMLVFAALGGETDFDEHLAVGGNAFALGLLWGALGGLIGAATALPLTAHPRVPPPAPPASPRCWPRCARSPWCSSICTAIALVGWLVQVAADAGGVRGRCARRR